MKKSLVSLLVGLSVVSSFSLSAAEEKQRWFEVEVIIFERNVNTTKIKEHWNEALYPTFSSNNLDPMALFLDKANLADLGEATEVSLLDGESLAQSAGGLQAGLIDDTSELPELGVQEETTPQISLDSPENTPLHVVKSTTVKIDGASLKPDAQYPELKIVPANELQLTEQFAALNKHANYNVLLHSAWRMPPVARKGALPIRLFAGHNFQEEYNMDGTAITRPVKANLVEEPSLAGQPINDATVIDLDGVEFVEDAVNPQNNSQLPAPILNEVADQTTITEQTATTVQAVTTPPVWQLDGELTIYLEHYLYAKTDLFIRKEGVKVIRSAPPALPTRVSEELITNKENDVDLLALSGIHLKSESEELSEASDILNKSNITENEDSAEYVTESGDNDQDNDTQADNAQVKERQVPFLHSYPMQQLRVIRSGEIHYLDHPLFGMIIQIRKYELPAESDSESESTATPIEIM